MVVSMLGYYHFKLSSNFVKTDCFRNKPRSEIG